MDEITVWSATPTPFLEDGALDRESLARLVEQHVGIGVTGVFLAGTCGEGAYMLNAQRAELTSAVRELAGDRLQVSVQVSDTSPARIRENMRRAADSGADSLVIAPPWLAFERAGDRDFVRRYFFEPIEFSPLPVGIYIRLPPAHVDIDLDLWLETVRHPKVRLLKDSSASEDYLAAFGAERSKRGDLMALTGYEFDVLVAARAGYDGCLLGTGILNGGMLRRALEALKSGNDDEAASWQERSNAFLLDMFREDRSAWLAGLKYALKRLGLFSSEFAHLMFPLDDDDRRRIDAALERERDVIMPD